MVERTAVNRDVVGSSPTWGAWSNPMIVTGHVERYDSWLRGQAVKTSPFHGGNTSSNLVGVIQSLFDLLFNTTCRRGSIGRAADL